jgi:hypothetical protein
MKIYEMMGAPGETDADADELIRLALEISKIQRLALTFSTFVPKRNTPLDGQPFMGVKPAEERLRRIREGLRGKVEMRPQSPRWAHIEYFLAQGGPEAGHAAIAGRARRRPLRRLGPRLRRGPAGDPPAASSATRPRGRAARARPPTAAPSRSSPPDLCDMSFATCRTGQLVRGRGPAAPRASRRECRAPRHASTGAAACGR